MGRDRRLVRGALFRGKSRPYRSYQALAKEVAPSGITVNAVSPGVINTEMVTKLGKDTVDMLREEIPVMRLGTPEDVANAVSFLADDRASYITGQVLSVNGGIVI